MNPDHSLFQAILDNPDDDTLRLVCADWLEEHGDDHRSEFIRVQVALAQLSPDDARRQALADREQELLAIHREEWLPDVLREPGCDCTFRRGFVDHIGISAEAFLSRADSLFRWPLLRSVAFGRTAEPHLVALAGSPHLARLAELDMRGFDSKYSFYILGNPETARAFFRSPHLRGLRVLRLGMCSSGSELVRALVESSLLRLTTLELRETHLSDEAGQTLAEAPFLAGLSILSLSQCGIGTGGVQALAGSSHLGRLTELDLSGNLHIRDAEVQALAASPHLSRLKRLDLCGCRVGDAGVLALAHSPWLSQLEYVNLRNTRVGATPEGMAAAARFSPGLAHPKALDLYGRGLDDAAIRVLASSPHLADVEQIDLQMNAIGDAGISALAASPYVGHLTSLHLGGNRIGPAGVRALADSSRLNRLAWIDLKGNPVGVGVAVILGSQRLLPLFAAIDPPYLDLTYLGLGDEGARAVAEAPALCDFTRLRLCSNDIHDDGAGALAASPHLARLTDLWLQNNQIGDDGLQALAASPHLACLTNLGLYGNPLTILGVQALTASPHLTGLTELHLPSGLWPGLTGWLRLPTRPKDGRLRWQFLLLGDEVLEELAAAPALRKFTRLDLRGNHFTARGVRALLASQHLGRLVEIRLDGNGFGDEGAQALATSPRLERLAILGLRRCSVDRAGIVALAASPHLSRLRMLDLGGSYLSQEAVEALLESSTLAGLKELDLRDCGGYAEEWVERLRGRFGARLRV
jgi:uncharacterized protein (TIGR02996 family)